MKISAIVTILTVLSFQSAFAAGLKVDLNPPEPRKDLLTPNWENWPWQDGKSGSKTFGDVTVAFRATEDATLTCVWTKTLLDYGAHTAVDGITVKDGASQIDMIITGLKPGKHTVTTYHSEVRNISLGSLDVLVADTVKVKAVKPTQRVTNDYEMASAHFEVDAAAGKDVVIHFRPTSTSGAGGCIINGFEIDTSDPTSKAIKPSPANDYEHVNADVGSASVSWTAPASAVSHDIYFGTDESAVGTADKKSPLFKGSQKAASWTSPKLDHTKTYYWRVDETDAPKKVTKGDVWSFRTRQLAFPTAEGYGRFARGGRGGRVIEVTNLNDSGPGSLRAAVELDEPRTIVFNVSGLITLERGLGIRNPYLTIAGQTAPGNGICVRKFNMGMGGTHDVIVRYMRVRPGNISGTTLDGMGMASSDNCIIDHCSISWTLDESFSSRGAKNITLQRTLISEALNEAGHKKYPPGTQHGYAASIGGDVGSFHHNLLAHCSGRNWSLAGGLKNNGEYAGRLDLRNNVVYNWKHRATDGGAHEVNFVNNYYKPGAATTFVYALNAQYGGFPGSQRYYFEGNVMPGHFGVTNQSAGRTATTERGGRLPTDYSPWSDSPFFDPYVKTHSAEEAYTNVLADVGCNFPVLDEHDKRIIQETRDGTFKFKGSKTGLPGLPDAQEDVGGWDEYPEVRRSADWDTDHDGMPNNWEKRAGLNPNDPTDGNADRDGDGYTNLEEYLGSLVGEFPDPDKTARKSLPTK